jgi:hypothetical protein
VPFEESYVGLGKEPTIVINGVTLSEAQAMTVRVAIGSFAISLNDGLLDGPDLRGISEGYKRCIDDIHRIIQQQ